MPPLPPLPLPSPLYFGPFSIPHSQVFHVSASRLSFALVNLKPLLPGHVLVCPVRRTPRLSQLTARETADLFVTVQRVSLTLRRVYTDIAALNVAVQDGVEAGQSVPHVHVHVIPRKKGDAGGGGEEGEDAIYEMMDGREGNLGQQFLDLWRRRKEVENGKKEFGGPDAETRKPRGDDEMTKEAEWLRMEMEKDQQQFEESEQRNTQQFEESKQEVGA